MLQDGDGDLVNSMGEDEERRFVYCTVQSDIEGFDWAPFKELDNQDKSTTG